MATEAGPPSVRIRRATERELVTGGMEMVTDEEDPSSLAWVAGPLQNRWAFGPLH